MKNQYAPFTSKGFRRFLVSLIVVINVIPLAAQTPLNETDVYNRLISRKTQTGYTEGTPWDNSHKYKNTVEFFGVPPGYYTGGGCYGFMMDMMEYASNYEYPIRKVEGTYDNLPEIHVGDGVRFEGDNIMHAVVVLKVDGSWVTVAEANYNSSVHWERKIDLSEELNCFKYIATFWPEVSNAIVTGITDNAYDSPTGDLQIYSLNGVLVKRISQTGLSVNAVLQELPKGFYIVKEATKTYKVYNGE